MNDSTAPRGKPAGQANHCVAVERLEPLSLTVREACRVSGLGRTALYELLKNGRLASTTLGRRRLISYASLRTLVLPPSVAACAARVDGQGERRR